MPPSSKETDGDGASESPRRTIKSDEAEAELRSFYWGDQDEIEKNAEAIAEMKAWFHRHFEDPEIDHLDRLGETSRSLFPNGGPYDPYDVLREQFGDFHNDDLIREARDSITSYGVHDWAPRPGGDFYENISDDDDSDDTELTRTQLARRILDRLDQVEKKLCELPLAPQQIGHNQPPDEIGTPPYSREDRDTLRQAITEVRKEVSSPDPNTRKLSEASDKIATVNEKIKRWIGAKIDLAVDESIKVGVKVFAFSQVYHLLRSIVSDIWLLISSST